MSVNESMHQLTEVCWKLRTDDLSEDNVGSIQPRSVDGADEKLRAISIGAGVGHRKNTFAFVLQFKVLQTKPCELSTSREKIRISFIRPCSMCTHFIRKLLSVDRFTSSSIVVCEITTLQSWFYVWGFQCSLAKNIIEGVKNDPMQLENSPGTWN